MNEHDDHANEQTSTSSANAPLNAAQLEEPDGHRWWPPRRWDPEWVTGVSTAVYALATIIFAVVAYFQLRALYSSISLTERTVAMSRVRERPWIAVELIVTILEKNPSPNTIAAQVIFKNFGALPATEVHSRVSARVRPAVSGASCPTEDALPPGMTEADLEHSLTVLAPGQSTGSGVKPDATKEEMQNVLSGSSFLFVYGHVEYFTPAQETAHSTKFCQRLVVVDRKPVTWINGPSGNSMN